MAGNQYGNDPWGWLNVGSLGRKSPASRAAGGLLTEVLRRLCAVAPDRRL
jgi:hypothetical protein